MSHRHSPLLLTIWFGLTTATLPCAADVPSAGKPQPGTAATNSRLEPNSAAHRLEPIQYNHPGLVVDLGVGLWAWPLPMDYDRDGDLDLVVSCPDKPYNGTYFFERPSTDEGQNASRDKGQGSREVAGTKAPSPSSLDPSPVFLPAVRVADGPTNVQVSYIDGEPVVMTPGKIYPDFRTDQYSKPIKLPLPEKLDPQYKRYRANQWKLLDWEGDGDLDVIAGIEIWDDYGWDDAWDAEGNWKNGPLHGFVYLVENVTSEDRGSRIEDSGAAPKPSTLNPAPPLTARLAALATAKFAAPRKLTTSDGNPIDVYGMPSPNFADFDADGDLDLICGEFLDGFTWFENEGTQTDAKFSMGSRLMRSVAGKPTDSPVRMDLEMITPVAIDWNDDGRLDLVCGDEDGRVALLERGADQAGVPTFVSPVYFRQAATDVKFGALVTPFGVDWDGDGDQDIIAGNTAGYIGFIENLSGGSDLKFAAPQYLGKEWWVGPSKVVRNPIRELAGPTGSIQGPCEAKWGYSTLSVADWDGNGSLDLVKNGIWGRVQVWTKRTTHFDIPRPEDVSIIRDASIDDPEWTCPKPEWMWWTPKLGELATQWRTTPCAVDWNGDELTDLVMLDHEGYLAFFPRSVMDHGIKILHPPQRVFKITGPCEFDQKHKPVGEKKDGLLRLNANRAGASGRRKLHFVDWDGDGRLDLLVNSVNVNWLRNVRTDEEGFTWFEDMGQLDDRVLAGHDTAPASVDWDQNGIPDLLVGAEDGRLYFKPNPRTVPTELEKRKLAERQAKLKSQANAGEPGGVSPRTEAISDSTSRPGPNGLRLADVAESDACDDPPRKDPTKDARPKADLVDDTQLNPLVAAEFIYDDAHAPTPQCHATTIAETPGGLVAAWFGGQHEKNPDVGIWVSRLVDGKWTPPVEVMNGVQHSTLRYPCWNPVLFQQPDGPLHLFAKCGPSPDTWWGTHQTSADHGVTWTRAVRLPSQIDGPVKNKPVLLSDGTLLCPSSTEYDGWRVHFELTNDWGLTWDRVGPINDGKEFNAIQPTILVQQSLSATKNPNLDGARMQTDLRILCRSREGSIVTSTSNDMGRTWSPLVRSRLPNPNSGIDAVTLKDGLHVLVYNHTKKGRSPLNVAVSEDGDVWKMADILESEPGEYSYPAVIQSADGLVHITYTWKRTKVKHVVLDPQKFVTRTIEDGN